MNETLERAGGDAPPRPLRQAVVLAQQPALRNTIVGHLMQLDCPAVYAETLAEAQRLIALHKPRLVFLECAQYPLHVREIAGLIGEAAGPDYPRPFLVGLANKDCPACEPYSCCLDEVLKPSPTLADIEALLRRRTPTLADAAQRQSGEPDADEDPAMRDPVRDIPPELHAALMKVFVDDTMARLERVHAWLDDFELSQVGREVHAIKSGCLQVGEHAMAKCCEQLRQATTANDSSAAQRHYDELVAAFRSVAGHLRS